MTPPTRPLVPDTAVSVPQPPAASRSSRSTMEAENSEVRAPDRSFSWFRVLFFLHVHVFGFWGLAVVFSQAYFLTSMFSLLLISLGMLGLTIGAHRLWAHATFQATTPLRVFLMLCHTLTAQCPIYDWVLDHRIHHAHHGTARDPYDFNKGFIFCHFTSRCYSRDEWFLAKDIHMTDLFNDPVIMFQKRYWWILMPFVSIVVPFLTPIRLWGELPRVSIAVVLCLRWAVLLQAAWLISSATIVWGLDPLDRKSGDTSLVFIVNKSLWPQYHYLLPWDYLTGEYGTYDSGWSTAIIKMLAVTGMAHSLVSISSEGVREGLAAAVNEDRPVIDCLKERQVITSKPSVLIE